MTQSTQGSLSDMELYLAGVYECYMTPFSLGRQISGESWRLSGPVDTGLLDVEIWLFWFLKIMDCMVIFFYFCFLSHCSIDLFDQMYSYADDL